jgi:hypothetical protein
LFSTSRCVDENEAHRSHVMFGRGKHTMISVSYEWMLRPEKNGSIDVPVGKPDSCKWKGKLVSPPRFDGIAAAGRIFVAGDDGRVRCFNSWNCKAWVELL